MTQKLREWFGWKNYSVFTYIVRLKSLGLDFIFVFVNDQI